LSKKILTIILVLAFYISVIAYSDFNKFSENILRFNFTFLPLILGFSLGGMIIKGIRQKLLLEKIGISISWKNSILLYLAGLSMIVTPGGSGELIKSYFLKIKQGHSKAKTFPLVIVERFYDLFAIITIISFTLFLFYIIEGLIIVIVASILLIISIIIMRSRMAFLFVQRFFEKISKLKKFLNSIDESYNSFQSLTTKKDLLKNWSLSLCAFGSDAVVVYLVFLGFEQSFNIIYTTSIIFSSLLFGVLTLMPAGIGVTEISVVGFLTKEGLDLSLATSIIIMIRLVSIWFATIIGFVTTKFFMSKKIKF